MERAGATSAPPRQKTCRLLSGPAALSAQLSLALVVVAALLLRRSRERPRRPARVFAFDVGKQFVSSGAAHVSGLVFAVLAARGRRAAGAEREGGRGTDGPSECGFYLVVFAVDTVVGSVLAIALHRACVSAAAAATARRKQKDRRSPPFPARFAAAVARCGDYSSPSPSPPQQPEKPRLSVFVPQLVEWTLCVVLARVACGLFVLSASQALSGVASGVDALFGKDADGGASYRPSLELFFVMLAGPLAMNAAQALVQDAVLRARGKGGTSRPSSSGGGGAAAAATSLPLPSPSSSSSPCRWEDEGAELLPSPPSHHHP